MLTVSRPFRLDKAKGKIMGVCAGIADFFGIEAMWVRLAFVLAALFGFGAPVLIYLVIGLVADRKSAL